MDCVNELGGVERRGSGGDIARETWGEGAHTNFPCVALPGYRSLRLRSSEWDSRVPCECLRSSGMDHHVRIASTGVPSVAPGGGGTDRVPFPSEPDEPLFTINPTGKKATVAAWTALDQYIVTAHEDGRLNLWDMVRRDEGGGTGLDAGG